MPDSQDTYYAILGVAENADLQTIRAAYRRQILQWHPDRNPDRQEEAHARTRQIVEAWEVLKDPTARREYDAHLARMRAAPSSARQSNGQATDSWRQSEYRRRAAETSQHAADWSVSQLLSLLWKGQPPLFSDRYSFRDILSIGFAGWVAVGFIAVCHTGVLALPAIAGLIALREAFFRNGRFVGLGRVVLGMLILGTAVAMADIWLISVLSCIL
jgi:DnaJ-domain-containing protein 1